MTAFADVGWYSNSLPSLMLNVDSTLRLIAQWKFIIMTDLTKAFYQIPLARSHGNTAGLSHPSRAGCTFGALWACRDLKLPWRS